VRRLARAGLIPVAVSASSDRPWRQGVEADGAWQTATSLFFSCGLQRLCPRLDFTIFLAGRGGEGEDSGALFRVRWSCWSYLDADVAFVWSIISAAISSSTTTAEGQPLRHFGRFSSTTFRWQEVIQLPSSMAVRQPLPPCSPYCWRRAFLL
jgi:hypothetical protein